MIPAEIHSDDRQAETQFDALPWFEQATDEQILALAKCDWGGDYPADDVASFVTDPEVGKVFDYLSREPHMGSAKVGFECHVNDEAALSWIKQNRSHLVPHIFVDMNHRTRQEIQKTREKLND